MIATAAAVDINNKRTIVGSVGDCGDECNAAYVVYLWTFRNN